MTKKLQNQYHPDFVSCPGETLRETLEAMGMSHADLVERTGLPIKIINGIINDKDAITPKIALQLEKVLGVPAAFWLNRERDYREFLDREKVKYRVV